MAENGLEGGQDFRKVSIRWVERVEKVWVPQ